MTKRRIPIEQARRLADRIVDELGPMCERLSPAGSVRRGKAWCGDIELVAIAKMGLLEGAALWSEPGSLLVARLDELKRDKRIYPVKEGERFRQYSVMKASPPVQFDLWITTPDAWGYQLAIRTGPADFSRWLVTPRDRGGGLRPGFRCHDGRVWRRISSGEHAEGLETCVLDDGGTYVAHPVPDETDFFNLIHGGYRPPEQRRL